MPVKIEKYTFSWILGWSTSRYKVFSECKRQYYFQYYGTRHAPRSIRERCQELKGLTAIPLEVGTLVHETMEALLRRLQKTESSIDNGKFEEFLREKASELAAQKSFSEVYYKERSEITVDDLFPSAFEGLTAFLKSERFEWILNEAINSKNEWLIEEPSDFGECRLWGLKAYCKLDAAFPVGGKYCVFDWKTGKPRDEKYKQQLLAYVAWINQCFNVSPENISGTLAYVSADYSEQEFSFNDADINDFKSRLRSETEDMTSFCKDINANTPVEMDLFAQRSDRSFCRFCKFRKLCA